MEALPNRGAKNNTTENFINEKWTLLLSSFSICLIIIFTPIKVSELTNDKISLDKWSGHPSIQPLFIEVISGAFQQEIGYLLEYLFSVLR